MTYAIAILSVCLSVTLVICVKIAKHIKHFAAPSTSSDTIPVILRQISQQYTDGVTFTGGIKYMWGVKN